MITWQLTRDCNLACLHCCTDSAPGRALPGELSRVQALGIGAQILQAEIPYVMLVGGEPLLSDHFLPLAELLGYGGTYLKIETNGQRFTNEVAKALSKLPIRSIQVSLDAVSKETYARQRPGGSLRDALQACGRVRSFGMPLEVTFAPTRINIHEAEDVIEAASFLGAFRFNTGSLMRLGTAARLWDRLEPTTAQYDEFLKLLRRKERELRGKMELAFRPFSIQTDQVASLEEPPGTLLILPDGRVKVTAGLPLICGDLKCQGIREAWDSYRKAWRHPEVAAELCLLAKDASRLALANQWRPLGEKQLSQRETALAGAR